MAAFAQDDGGREAGESTADDADAGSHLFPENGVGVDAVIVGLEPGFCLSFNSLHFLKKYCYCHLYIQVKVM